MKISLRKHHSVPGFFRLNLLIILFICFLILQSCANKKAVTIEIPIETAETYKNINSIKILELTNLKGKDITEAEATKTVFKAFKKLKKIKNISILESADLNEIFHIGKSQLLENAEPSLWKELGFKQGKSR